MIIVRHQYSEELYLDASDIEPEYEDDVVESVYRVRISATYEATESELAQIRQRFSRADPTSSGVASLAK